MPHDRNGKELTIGDEVTIAYVITAISDQTVTLQIKYPITRQKNLDYGDLVTVRNEQVVKLE